MKLLKILLSPMSLASRDRRELSVVKELGAEVAIMAKAEKEGVDPGISGVELHNPTTRPLGERCPVVLNRVLSIFTWAHYAKKLHPDVISGHDLPGLTVAWLSTWFIPRRKRPLLVYDAHEFEIGRETGQSRLKKRMVCGYERFLIKKCAFSIMVNDAIADEVQKIHKLKDRPVVARNIPPCWKLQQEDSLATRRMFCEKLGMPESTFITMYHGMVAPVRGVETLLEATALVEGTGVVVLGNGTDEYLGQLREKCTALGITDRVIFVPGVPNRELWKYVSAVDAGVIAIRPLNRNSVFSLPNKLFENIQGMTPVIVSDMPVQAKLVSDYGIGLIFKAGSAESLAEQIERLRGDRELYESLKNNLIRAKSELCWENEKKKLAEAYRAAFDAVQKRS